MMVMALVDRDDDDDDDGGLCCRPLTTPHTYRQCSHSSTYTCLEGTICISIAEYESVPRVAIVGHGQGRQ